MIITIIAIIALSVFPFSMDLSWSNVVSAERNDLVFEGRNTSYGAYAIRKNHHLNVFYALLLSVGLIGGGFCGVSLLNGKPEQKVIPAAFSIVIPMDISPIEKVEKKDTQKPKDEKPQQRSSGQDNREVVVVENKAALPIASDLDRRNIQQGGGGDDPIGIVEPYVPPGDGGEGGGTELLPEKKKARRYVKNPPVFPGGVDEMMAYMKPRVRYSDHEIDRNVEGTIYISFVVNEDGSIGEVTIERGIRNGDRLASKAIDAIHAMPRWKPGDDGEEPLPVIVTMPLRFELHD